MLYFQRHGKIDILLLSQLLKISSERHAVFSKNVKTSIFLLDLLDK